MAKLGNIFNKEEIKKEEQHPRRTIKWIHYSKLKTNPGLLPDIKDVRHAGYL